MAFDMIVVRISDRPNDLYGRREASGEGHEALKEVRGARYEGQKGVRNLSDRVPDPFQLVSLRLGHHSASAWMAKRRSC